MGGKPVYPSSRGNFHHRQGETGSGGSEETAMTPGLQRVGKISAVCLLGTCLVVSGRTLVYSLGNGVQGLGKFV